MPTAGHMASASRQQHPAEACRHRPGPRRGGCFACGDL